MKSLKRNLSLLSVILLLIAHHAKPQSSSDYEMIAEDGAWCWFSDPRAVYHRGAEEKIYYSYISSEGDVVISSRDARTKAIETFVLHERLQVDDHNVASILVLPDGKILTFYTEHNGRFFMRQSRSAEDISAWEEEKTISFGLTGKRICYSHPVMLSAENNRIYVFFRAVTPGMSYKGWGQYFSYSDDEGKTWADAAYFLDTKAINNAPYLKISSDNKSRIDILFTDGHPKIGAASIYHVYYEKGKFRQTNGNHIADVNDIPLQLHEITRFYDADEHKTRSWIWDIALDKKNRPVIAYTRYPSVKDHIYHYARWDGNKWNHHELVNSGGYITEPEKSGKVLEEHYSGGVVLDHHNPDNVFLSREINGIFELAQWQLKGKHWKTTAVTKNSNVSNIRPYVVAHYPGNQPIVLWMKGNYEHYTRYDTDLMMAETRD